MTIQWHKFLGIIYSEVQFRQAENYQRFELLRIVKVISQKRLHIHVYFGVGVSRL